MKTTWDFSNFYASNDEFLKDFEIAKKLLKNIEKFKGKLQKNNKKIILEYLKADVEFSLIAENLAVYARMKYDENGKDDVNLKNYQQTNAFFSEMGQKLAFAKTELAGLSEKDLRSMQEDLDFADFDRYIEEIIRTKKHVLSEKDEMFMASLSNFSNSDDIYSMLTNIEMDHGVFENEKGEKIQLTTGNFNFYMKSPNPETRKKVLEEYLGRYAGLSHTIAGLYSSHVKYINFLAKSYGYNSAREMLAFEEEVNSDIQLKNLEQVSSRVDLLQKYFNLKKEILKLDKFYTSDIMTPLSLLGEDNVTYEESVEDIKNSLKVLGEDYTQMFETAINDGWIDVFPRENKSSGGYTISSYLMHPYILLNFDGTNYWKSAISHEFGHAMHSYYSAKNQPYAKHNYTIFVAEVASLTNEILLSIYMLEKEQNPLRKMEILAEFLQLFYLNVYNSTMLSEFEIFAHDSFAGGEELSANDYTLKFKQLCMKFFGSGVNLNNNYEYDWCRKPHLFRDYYLYKYSTGLISACAVAQMIRNDKSGDYVKKYKQFLSLGGSMDPVSSLKLAGVDITSDKTFELAFGLFEDYLNELENLQKKHK